MKLADKARRLERRLARTLDAAIGELVGTEEPAPIEIVHAVLERAEREVQDIGRGRRLFPFNRVRVHVLSGAPDRQALARLEAVLAGPPSLAERLADRLREAGCGDAHPAAEIVPARKPGADWQDARFHVTFDRVAEAPVAPSCAPRLKLAVVKGSAAQRVYTFAGGRIDIGRQADVVDQRQRLIRSNHVAFADGGADENGSVSRRHAHVAFDERDAVYRIWDDRSAHGTSIVRAGRTIRVPPGARGARLRPGDEIVLGQARLTVTID